jgi:hypothetical protein
MLCALFGPFVRTPAVTKEASHVVTVQSFTPLTSGSRPAEEAVEGAASGLHCALAEHADRVRVAEISGNRVVTFTGMAPRAWSIPSRATEVVGYVAPADPQRVRVVLAVDARDLLDVLAAAQRDGLVVDHIYDY